MVIPTIYTNLNFVRPWRAFYLLSDLESILRTDLFFDFRFSRRPLTCRREAFGQK